MRKSLVRASIIAMLLIAGLSASAPAFAQPAPGEDLRTPINTEVPIPVTGDVPGSEDRFKTAYLTSGKVEDLAQYLGIIYNFLISVVGLVAAVMMVIGGFQYLTSAGDSAKIGAAKSRMGDALIGLVLALGAYTILNTINPRLLQLKLPGLADVKSELIAMPWCDVVQKQYAVNPIYGDPAKCGSVGEYMPAKTRLSCIYRGPCPNFDSDELPSALKTSTGMRSVCVQTLTTNAYVNDPLTPEQVFELSEKGDAFIRLGIPDCWKEFNVPSTGCNDSQARQWRLNHSTWTNPQTGKVRNCPQEKHVSECDYNDIFSWAETVVKEEFPAIPFGTPRSKEQLSGSIGYFARCMSCLEYGAVEQKRSQEATPGGYVYQTPHENRCAYWQDEANAGVGFSPGSWDKRKAMNQPLMSYCRWMPDERGCAQADFTCKEPTPSSSCSNYNSIKPFFMFDIERGGFAWWIYGYDKNGTLSSRPDALANVCYANPCGYNPGKGCTGAGGIVNGIRTAAAVVRDGIAGIQSCDDKK